MDKILSQYPSLDLWYRTMQQFDPNQTKDLRNFFIFHLSKTGLQDIPIKLINLSEEFSEEMRKTYCEALRIIFKEKLSSQDLETMPYHDELIWPPAIKKIHTEELLTLYIPPSIQDILPPLDKLPLIDLSDFINMKLPPSDDQYINLLNKLSEQSSPLCHCILETRCFFVINLDRRPYLLDFFHPSKSLRKQGYCAHLYGPIAQGITPYLLLQTETQIQDLHKSFVK